MNSDKSCVLLISCEEVTYNGAKKVVFIARVYDPSVDELVHNGIGTKVYWIHVSNASLYMARQRM